MNMTLRWGRVSHLAAYSNAENTAIGKGTSPTGPSNADRFVPQSALSKSGRTQPIGGRAKLN